MSSEVSINLRVVQTPGAQPLLDVAYRLASKGLPWEWLVDVTINTCVEHAVVDETGKVLSVK